MQKEHSLYVEKYRPATLEEFIVDENLKKNFKQYIDNQDIPNLLLYGPPGIGKTTLAKIFSQNIDSDVLYINASDERGIDTIRDKVQRFASSASFRMIKIVILDEADFLTLQAQASLRNIIETYSRSTRFVLTANYIGRILEPIQSRCVPIQLDPPSKGELAKNISSILDKEGVKHKLEDLAVVINKTYPDMRRALNVVQSSLDKGELVLDSKHITAQNYIKQVLRALSEKSPKFLEIRQIIIDSNVTDFDDLYEELFKHLSYYLPGKEGSGTIAIHEHQYKAQFRIDKEINISSLIATLINIKKS